MNAPITVPDLLDGASRLGSNDFESFFKEMLALRAQRIAPVLTQKEALLLERIYTKLPVATLEQYDQLSEKRRLGTISEDEYRILLDLIPIVEQYNVDRVKSLVELASLRNVTAQALMKQLDLMPLHNG